LRDLLHRYTQTLINQMRPHTAWGMLHLTWRRESLLLSRQGAGLRAIGSLRPSMHRPFTRTHGHPMSLTRTGALC
jgi:hypothetical protein